ncbi:MAG TPA: transketolase C-terminal domain-containing protein, partial [Dehalococcoidales bacterium]|nr:transketolase C-terminal domain-containing protein [Dehalococcoidales bacterium]
KIVTAGGGLIYGALGPTHHLTEDVALMRALPNMTVIAPGDPLEAGLVTQAAALLSGPCYLRLGRTGDPQVHHVTPDFQIGRAIKLRDGRDITLIASGGILPNVCRAAENLAGQHIEALVLSMHTVKPVDKEAVLDAARDTGAIVTIEEHSVLGGLGSAVAEVIAESGLGVPFLRIGLPDEFISQVGSRDYLRNIYSLSTDGIVSSVKKFLKQKKR